MSKNMKIVLIILGCVLLLCTGIAGAGFYWVSTSGKELFDQVKNGTNQAMQEGKELGKNSDMNVCVTESLQRLGADKSMTSQMSATLFLTECLENAKPTPGFCNGVPQQSGFINSVDWVKKKCSGDQSAGKGCEQVMQVVIRHCEKSASASPAP